MLGSGLGLVGEGVACPWGTACNPMGKRKYQKKSIGTRFFNLVLEDLLAATKAIND